MILPAMSEPKMSKSSFEGMAFRCQEAANATPLHHLLRCDILFKAVRLDLIPSPTRVLKENPSNPLCLHVQVNLCHLGLKEYDYPQLLPVTPYYTLSPNLSSDEYLRT